MRAKINVTPLIESRFASLAEAEGRSVFGSLSSFFVDPSVVRAAEREGLLVFGLATGLLEVLNSAGFKPREF